MISVKVGHSVSIEEDFEMSSIYFATSILSSNERRHDTSIEQTLIFFPQGHFVRSLDDFGPLVLDKTISNVIIVFRYFACINFGKECDPSYEQT